MASSNFVAIRPGGVGGGVRPASQTLTLFLTKICDFPTLFMIYPKIYDGFNDNDKKELFL